MVFLNDFVNWGSIKPSSEKIKAKRVSETHISHKVTYSLQPELKHL